MLLNRIAKLHLILNAFIVPRNWYMICMFYALQSPAKNLLKEASHHDKLHSHKMALLPSSIAPNPYCHL
jgi:hypothetical protein